MGINLADTVFKVWLVVPIIGHIRITTVFTFVAAFFCVICRFRSRLKDAFYQAVVLVGFATSIYEIVFNLVAAYVFLKTIDSFIQHLLIWHYIMAGGWLILGFRQARQSFVSTKASIILFIVCLFAWILWVSIGFPYNIPSSATLNLHGEILNIVTKATLPFAYALGLQPNRSNSIRPIG